MPKTHLVSQQLIHAAFKLAENCEHGRGMLVKTALHGCLVNDAGTRTRLNIRMERQIGQILDQDLLAHSGYHVLAVYTSRAETSAAMSQSVLLFNGHKVRQTTVTASLCNINSRCIDAAPAAKVLPNLIHRQ